MTLQDFLKTVFISDHEDEARYPDGSGGKDEFRVFMQMRGHGPLLDAEVTDVHVSRGMMLFTLQGKKGLAV